jgi:DNA polymerase-3 subunit delta'
LVAVSLNPIATAPWIAAQTKSLLAQRGHAWLLAGPSGLGQYDVAMALVRAWLCENPANEGACGLCASCHAIDVHAHADLCVLMPETAMLEMGLPLSEKAQDDIDSKKRKASKEIRVEAMRDAVEFAQRTSARGRGKAVLVFPAERMNVYTANALLKTLEEPPGDVRFALATDAAHQLLPTIRSRCLTHAMWWPDDASALAWLQGLGIASSQARIMLRAAGGRPQDAMQYVDLCEVWPGLPRAVFHGNVAVFKDWSPAQTLSALHKLCHDLLAQRSGAAPRFFELNDLPQAGTWQSLTNWSAALSNAMRTVEHPFNAGLMQEALVSQAQLALNSHA